MCYDQVELIEPAVKGTLNVLEACVEAKVKRVIVVSSGTAVFMNPSWPQDKVKAEFCWSDKDFQKKLNVINYNLQIQFVKSLLFLTLDLE